MLIVLCVLLCVGLVFTVELAADQLHAQSARLATHHGDDADVLSDDWGVKQVGLATVVIYISCKHLSKRGEK